MNYVEYTVRVSVDGTQKWFNKSGQLHRLDGPAFSNADGDLSWWVDGQCHREGEPAKIFADGVRCWYQHGELHNDTGPSIIDADGTEHWYWYGKECSKSECERLSAKPTSCNGKIVEIDGRRYTLVEIK